MFKLDEIYKKNKELDSLFLSIYGGKIDDILLKNMLELLVEIGELANEVKSFKYWKEVNVDKNKVIHEFTDALLMILFFANTLDMTLNEDAIMPVELDVNKQLIYLFQLGAELPENYNKAKVSELLLNLIHLKDLLDLKDDEVYNYAIKNILEIKERLESK